MAEILFNENLTVLNGQALVRDINVAQDIEGGWTLAARPIDSGPSDPITIAIDRLIGGEPDSLVAATALTLNTVNPFERTEPVTRLRVTLTPGATAPDGGVRIQILGSRN